MSENNADKRPRVYQSLYNDEFGIEITVQGAEGEDSTDVAKVAEERLESLIEKQRESESEEYNGPEHQ